MALSQTRRAVRGHLHRPFRRTRRSACLRRALPRHRCALSCALTFCVALFLCCHSTGICGVDFSQQLFSDFLIPRSNERMCVCVCVCVFEWMLILLIIFLMMILMLTVRVSSVFRSCLFAPIGTATLFPSLLGIQPHMLALQRRYIRPSIAGWQKNRCVNYVVYFSKIDLKNRTLSLRVLSSNRSIAPLRHGRH